MNIFDPNEQILDLLRVNDNGVKQLSKNPLNILWILENNGKNHPLKDDYINKIKNSNLTKNSSRKIHPKHGIGEMIMDEDMISKRIENILLVGGTLEDKGINVVRYKSLKILQKMLELGMNINYIEKDNNPFRESLKIRSMKISEYLWSFSNLDKTHVDKDGNNIAHLSVKNKNHILIPLIWAYDEKMFYIDNKNNKNAIEYFCQWNNDSNLSFKNRENIKTIISQILDKYFNNNQFISKSNIESIQNNVMTNEIYKQCHYNFLNIQLKNNSVIKNKNKI